MAENSNFGDTSYPHDIFDRMFKRLLTLSSKTEIRFLNGLFGTDYPDDSRLTYNWTEFEDDKMRKILADTIVTVNDKDSFHIEAEMSDQSIILRVLEYGFSHTLRTMQRIMDPETGEEAYTVTFPRQAVIYLDSAGTVPETQTVIIHFGDEGVYRHRVNIIRFQEKTYKEIQERNMILLLPFKLLSLRTKLQKDRSPENIERLRALYEDDIICLIERSYLIGQITAEDRRILSRLSRTLIEHLYQQYEEAREVIGVYDHSLKLDIDEYIDALEEKEEQLASKDEQLASKDEQLASKDEQLASKDEQLASKDELIRTLTERLSKYESVSS